MMPMFKFVFMKYNFKFRQNSIFSRGHYNRDIDNHLKRSMNETSLIILK